MTTRPTHPLHLAVTASVAAAAAAARASLAAGGDPESKRLQATLLPPPEALAPLTASEPSDVLKELVASIRVTGRSAGARLPLGVLSAPAPAPRCFSLLLPLRERVRATRSVYPHVLLCLAHFLFVSPHSPPFIHLLPRAFPAKRCSR